LIATKQSFSEEVEKKREKMHWYQRV